MDFDAAITAHSAWKKKLSAYIQKPDHSLQISEIAVDNKCELGRWIAGEGAKFSSLPEYAKLKSEHIRFHKAAADVVRRADSGGNVSAEVALGAKSEYTAASTGVEQAIMAIKSKV